jgi:hypothetical protein
MPFSNLRNHIWIQTMNNLFENPQWQESCNSNNSNLKEEPELKNLDLEQIVE